MFGYIYLITDTTNGKQYIGQHKYDKAELDPSYHGSGHIIKEIYKKRPETLLEELLFVAETFDELNYFETYFIKHLNTLYPNGYNLNTGGDSRIMCEDTKRKISQRTKEGMTPEICQKVSESLRGKPTWNKGIPCREETKKKLSEALSGENNPNYCKKRSEETKRKQSEALKGRTLSEETKQNISAAKKGKPNGRMEYSILPKEEVCDYYFNKKFTKRKIAMIFNCAVKTVRRVIKQFENKNI